MASSTDRMFERFAFIIPDRYGHRWVLEPRGDIPKNRTGWECADCHLFLMTEKKPNSVTVFPSEAERLYVSCGTFTPHLWKYWTCEEYKLRLSGFPLVQGKLFE